MMATFTSYHERKKNLFSCDTVIVNVIMRKCTKKTHHDPLYDRQLKKKKYLEDLSGFGGHLWRGKNSMTKKDNKHQTASMLCQQPQIETSAPLVLKKPNE